MIAIWVRGLVRRRGGRLAAAAAGIALAVALLASLAAFLAASRATMTQRATREVAVDWQVQVQPGAADTAVAEAVRTQPGTRAALPVRFAASSGFTATTSPPAAPGGGPATTTQTTGPGVVLGLPAGYRSTFPQAVRTMAGADQGVLLAQQTAANLHAGPSDQIQIGRAGLPPASVTVAGVVALPQADSLFQRVGAPPTSQPVAPPDNVILLPEPLWRQVFEPLRSIHPGLLSTQIHAARDHRLPPDPAQAYTVVTGAARNLELRAGGVAVVGDNLAAALDTARSDAAYAQLLFVFLALPGAVLAGLLTVQIAAAGAGRRRREQAMLRARGAASGQVLALAAAEALLVGLLGAVAGLAAAAVISRFAWGEVRFGATSAGSAGWLAAAVAVGLVIAVLAVLVPARRDLRATTVAAARQPVGRASRLGWARIALAVGLLGAAAAVFAATRGAGYQLVLAPEGVPAISVSYWALAGPALLWLGAALLIGQLVEALLSQGGRALRVGLRAVAGPLAATAAAMLARRRRAVARSVLLLALTLAFAASTAAFNATYRQQAEIDAQLTNGADVTVTESPGHPVSPAQARRLAGVPGVRAAEPLLHRYAYVGADLQDLYGVDPATIGRATTVRDAYFTGGTAAQLLARLATAPDSVLVSAETVRDFQLQPGDPLTLRLTDARTGGTIPVPFHFAGVVTEFPTAPRDSFLVANAAYVARVSGSDGVGSVLLDTGGRDTAAVAARVRQLFGPGAQVSDISSVRGQVGSSLTSVDLAALTRLELAFALVLAVASGGLVLALGLTERRRGFAVTVALGARRDQLRRLLLGETTVLGLLGLLAAAALGTALVQMLVAVLTGVFDPPPDHVAVPWSYLGALAALTVLTLLVVTVVFAHPARRDLSALREP